MFWCLIKSFCINVKRDSEKLSGYGSYLFHLAVKIIVYLPRDKDIDKPQIVFLSLIGNDVCNGRYPTEPNFTTEEEFRTKTLQTLDHLGQFFKIPRDQIMKIFLKTKKRQNFTIWISCHYDWFG